MKQLLYLFLPVLLLASCSKGDSDTPAQDGNFNITGVRDVDLSVTSDGRYSFNISVVPSAGGKDTVTLSGEKMPGGIYVNFSPRTGVTPFTATVTVYTDFLGSLGGTFPFELKGTGKSGSRTYDVKVTTAAFRGWKVGGGMYEPQSVIKRQASATEYAQIRVLNGQGAQLVLSFAPGVALPAKNTTFSIGADTSAKNNINVTFFDGINTYRATGYDGNGQKGVSGNFTFDTLKKFTFRCDNVELSDGFTKQPLSCNFSEY